MDSEVKHIHYWLLPPPDGNTVIARCRDCGATREMPNTWDEAVRRQGMSVQQADVVAHFNYERETKDELITPF